MNPPDFMTMVLRDIKTDLADEFDRNFERKAFFNDPWPQKHTPIIKVALGYAPATYAKA